MGGIHREYCLTRREGGELRHRQQLQTGAHLGGNSFQVRYLLRLNGHHAKAMLGQVLLGLLGPDER